METAEHSAPDRACILPLLPPKTSGIFAEEGVKGVHKPGVYCTLATRKQCDLDTPGQMHKCNRLEKPHKTRASPSQPNASIDMTVWHETSCLNLKLLSTISYCKGQRPFSLITSSLVRGLCSSGSPHVQGYLGSTNFDLDGSD